MPLLFLDVHDVTGPIKTRRNTTCMSCTNTEGLNGLPLKSLISKTLAQILLISKILAQKSLISQENEEKKNKKKKKNVNQ